MTGAQWEVLRSFTDESVMEIVRGRLLQGLKFFEGNTLVKTYSREQVKLALLIVRIANPGEYFNEAEKAVIEGGARGRQQKDSPHKAQNSPRKRHLRPRSQSGEKPGA